MKRITTEQEKKNLIITLDCALASLCSAQQQCKDNFEEPEIKARFDERVHLLRKDISFLVAKFNLRAWYNGVVQRVA